MDIFKLILQSGLDTDTYPRIFFNEKAAQEEAYSLLGTDYDDKPGEIIEQITICRERPNTSLGWFVTCGMEIIKPE